MNGREFNTKWYHTKATNLFNSTIPNLQQFSLQNGFYS